MGLASVGERFPKRLLTVVNIDLAFPAIQQSLAFSVVFGGGLLAVANRLAMIPVCCFCCGIEQPCLDRICGFELVRLCAQQTVPSKKCVLLLV